MKDRKAVKGGTDINAKDFAFAKKIYPKDLGSPKTTCRRLSSRLQARRWRTMTSTRST